MTGLRTGCSFTFKTSAVIFNVRLGDFVLMVTSPEDYMCVSSCCPRGATIISTEPYIKELNAVVCAINSKSLKFASFSFLFFF